MGTLKIALKAIFLFATVATVFSAVATHENKNHRQQIHDLKELSWKQRFNLYMISKLNPKALNGLPKDVFAEISERPDITSIDNFFVDARQLFTQASKIDEAAHLLEFHWLERWDFCFPFWIEICFDFEISWTTKDTKYVGAESITQSTKFTPTTFENTFHIPYFNWTSPGFTYNYTDYSRQEIGLLQNTYISLTDVTIIFAGEYKFVPDVGIQLDNVAIYFNAGKVSWFMNDITHWDFNGNLLERYDPIEYYSQKYMMDHWTWAKKEYVPGLQYSLNCFLSNDRSDPECVNVGDHYYNDYYRFLNMELIQTIGLGALLSS